MRLIRHVLDPWKLWMMVIFLLVGNSLLQYTEYIYTGYILIFLSMGFAISGVYDMLYKLVHCRICDCWYHIDQHCLCKSIKE